LLTAECFFFLTANGCFLFREIGQDRIPDSLGFGFGCELMVFIGDLIVALAGKVFRLRGEKGNPLAGLFG
jgi:hypothetical protein